MTFDASIFGYFWQAGLIVKCVMLILIGASLVSWSYIIERRRYMGSVKKQLAKFEESFWSGKDLASIYTDSKRRHKEADGADAIFQAGFEEFVRLCKLSKITNATIIGNTRRAMLASQLRLHNRLEKNLSFLAIVGSTSPYIGLFGTVWGIMQAMRGLANVQQATIAMVAPGIAEALIATAMGLFAAIPAVIAYNRNVNAISQLMARFDAFQEEFINILVRQSQALKAERKSQKTMEDSNHADVKKAHSVNEIREISEQPGMNPYHHPEPAE